MKKFRLIVATLSLILAPSAHAQTGGKEAVIRAAIERHIAAFHARDLPGLAADYADDSVLVLADQVFQGKAATLKFFEAFFGSSNNVLQTPANEFELHVDKVEGDVGTLLWVANRGTPKAMTGEDVFVFRNGKIAFQTAIKVGPFKGQ